MTIRTHIVPLLFALLLLGVASPPGPVHAQSVGDLVITEFMANPAAVSDADGEYVEIYNRSSTPYDLDGFRLRDDGSNDHSIEGSLTMAPGTFLVLARSADPAGDGTIAPDYVYDAFTLSNSADEIVLETAGGIAISRITYTDGDAGGSGVALEVASIGPDGGDGVVDQSGLIAATTEIGNGDLGSPGAFGDSVLPVELAAFRVTVDGRAARLRWTTTSETGNAGFEILHRMPGEAWAAQGFVDGAGTTTEARTYRFVVPDLVPGLHAFRLRQVDVDGTSSFGPVRAVQVAAEVEVIIRGPNPLTPGTTADVTVAVPAAQRLDVGLYNLLGQRVRTVFTGTATPTRTVRAALSTEGLAGGLYVLRVTGPTATHTERITVVR
jgi:hypothetical protein